LIQAGQDPTSEATASGDLMRNHLNVFDYQSVLVAIKYRLNLLYSIAGVLSHHLA